MTLMPYGRKNWLSDPFKELEMLQREMNKLFDLSYSGNPWQETNLLASEWAPAIDVYDSKDNILVKAELPGLKKDEIDVSIQNDQLVIKGEKKKDSEVNEDDYYKTERFYGSFYRSIQLPTVVKEADIAAKYENGVLNLTLPKKEESKPKQITVDIR